MNTVTVTTSARLHIGFFDLERNATCKFGSLGLSIASPCTQVALTKSEKTLFSVNCSENDVKIFENIAELLNIRQQFSLNIIQSIPRHAGLGSGTQMALAIGAGLNQLFNLGLTVPQIAKLTKRGNRSGIGIAAFEHGGFLMDNGRMKNEGLPEITTRIPFPETWRVLLVQDSTHVGVHGAAELQAFEQLKTAQGNLRKLVEQQMLPALQRADLFAFGAIMSDLQAYNGDYFAPIQGGRFASQDVANVLQSMQKNGASCVGQSSWGPTGFAIVENEVCGLNLLSQSQRQFADQTNIRFQMVRGNNAGASIKMNHLES